MTWITIDDYFMGRRALYPTALTPALEKAAAITVDLVNKMLDRAAAAGIRLVRKAGLRPGDLGTHVVSGWRPPVVNAATPNAAPSSKHMTCQACDTYDPDGDLDEWLMTPEGQAVLEELGLWLEHPASTKTWSHVQTVPPHSGNRVFYP